MLGRSLPRRLESALRRHRPDLVLVLKGAALEPEAVGHLRRQASSRWANWFPDDPHRHDLSGRLALVYDRFFTHDSASAAVHAVAGARAGYLPFGVDPVRFAPRTPGGRWRAPMTFVGTRDPVRAAALEALAPLGATAWGPGWRRPAVYGARYLDALAGGDVGLNMHQNFAEPPPARGYGTGANLRVFELAALGRAQLCDAKADIAALLSPGREIVLYRSLAELRGLARELLADPARRASLGEAARRRVVAGHTWAHRLEELLAGSLG